MARFCVSHYHLGLLDLPFSNRFIVADSMEHAFLIASNPNDARFVGLPDAFCLVVWACRFISRPRWKSGFASIAALLAAATHRLKRVSPDLAEVAADVVGAFNPAVRVKLVCKEDVTRLLLTTDVYFNFSYDLVGSYRVSVFPIKNGVAYKELFSGTLADFTTWASTQTGLEPIVNKVVQF